MPDGRRAYGTISLAPDKPPSVVLRPDQPIDVGSQGMGSLQSTYVDSLVGYLDSNDEVILGDVHLYEWFPNRFHASSRWALIGLSVTQVPYGRWNSLEVRVTGLECLLGNAIAAIFWPKGQDTRPLRYSADLDADAEFVSTHDGITLTAKFNPIFSVGDPYRFDLRNVATAKFVATTPLTVDEWVRGWVDPLVGLISLATGEQEAINTVSLASPDSTSGDQDSPVPAETTGQLFGGGIQQRDQPAERRTRKNGIPLIPLFTLGKAPPLATLVRSWQTGLMDATATSLYRLSIDPTLPSHVRYLLCAQAIEALDRSIHAAEEESDEDAYANQYQSVVEAIKLLGEGQLDKDTRRFIRENLSRRPHRPLAGRLRRLVSEVPGHDALEGTWMKETKTLGTQLDGLGRLSSPLHERLASARNALSHGSSLSTAAVTPAMVILQTLLRGQLLVNLGFPEDQLTTAYERMTRGW